MATHKVEVRDGGEERIAVAEGERLDIELMPIGEGKASLEVTVGKGSDLRMRCGLGALRVSTRVRIEGEGARVAVAGAYGIEGDAHQSADVTVEHAAPGSRSRIRFAGWVAGGASARIGMRTVVAPGADGTQASQRSKAIVEDDVSKVIALPELEIYSEDVSCSHGVSVGAIDRDQVRYMVSRGMAAPDAERLLKDALLADALAVLGEDFMSL